MLRALRAAQLGAEDVRRVDRHGGDGVGPADRAGIGGDGVAQDVDHRIAGGEHPAAGGRAQPAFRAGLAAAAGFDHLRPQQPRGADLGDRLVEPAAQADAEGDLPRRRVDRRARHRSAPAGTRRRWPAGRRGPARRSRRRRGTACVQTSTEVISGAFAAVQTARSAICRSATSSGTGERALVHQRAQRIGVERAEQPVRLDARLPRRRHIQRRGRKESAAGIEPDAGVVQSAPGRARAADRPRVETITPSLPGTAAAARGSSASRPARAAASNRSSIEVTPLVRSSRICAFATAGSGSACSCRMSQPATSRRAGSPPRTRGETGQARGIAAGREDFLGVERLQREALVGRARPCASRTAP